jgi:hypothetical protein
MAAMTISPERLSTVESRILKMVADFNKPLDDVGDFCSSYHPDVHWYDHAFLIHRKGHEAALGLHKAFRHCNQPFEAKIKVSFDTSSGHISLFVVAHIPSRLSFRPKRGHFLNKSG